MKIARCMVFNLLFYGLTALLCVVCLPALLMPRYAVWFCAKLWARLTLALAHFICGIRMELRGLEHRKDTQVIFASKHQSAFETVAYTAILKKPAFILKRELLFLPLFGLYLLRIGCVPINRGAGASAIKRMVKIARARLEEGYSLVIFAEGTRSAPDVVDPPYMPGVAALYSQLNVPVVPVALNSGLCWGRKALLKKPGVVTVEFLPPMEPGMDRKAFMGELKAQIETRSAALRDAERARLAKIK